MNTVKYFFNFVLYDCMILIIKLSKAQVFKILECLLSGQKIDNESTVNPEIKSQQSNFLDLGILAAMLNSSKIPPKQSSELNDHHKTKSSENVQVDQIDTSDQQANEQMNSLIQSFLNQSYDYTSGNISLNNKKETFKNDQHFANPRGINFNINKKF
jgi:hypothetical protein